jgi:hypothetical protein
MKYNPRRTRYAGHITPMGQMKNESEKQKGIRDDGKIILKLVIEKSVVRT